jgi:hypothetical protein
MNKSLNYSIHFKHICIPPDKCVFFFITFTITLDEDTLLKYANLPYTHTVYVVHIYELYIFCLKKHIQLINTSSSHF